MDFNWLLAMGLFVAATLVDALFAMYTVAIIKTKAFQAASLSLLMYALEAFAIVSYINEKLYLVPLAAGAFLGSYIVVKREEIQKNKKTSKR